MFDYVSAYICICIRVVYNTYSNPYLKGEMLSRVGILQDPAHILVLSFYSIVWGFVKSKLLNDYEQ